MARKSDSSGSPAIELEVGERPDWINTVRVYFPCYGRHADELCVRELPEVI